jgi:hypothetical protein
MILCRLLALLVFVAAARADFLSEARELVANGEHESAAPLFEKHLQSASPSAAVYFELGKSLEASGREADSALAFRRALILDPGFQPALEALKSANIQLGLASPRSDWRTAVANRISLDGFTHGGAVIFWLGAFLFATGLFLSKRRAVLWSAVGLAFIGLAMIALAWMVDPRVSEARDIMVVSEEGSVLYKTPSEEDSQKITTLGQCSVLKILNARGRWFHGELPGGQRGWFLQKGTLPVIPPV